MVTDSAVNDPRTVAPRTRVPCNDSSCVDTSAARTDSWRPLAGSDLLDRLRSTGRARPSSDPALASELRSFVEREIEDLASTVTSDVRVITRDRLTRALTCPIHQLPDRSGDRSFSVSLARGALMDVLFRQVVTTGTIGDPLDEGLEALSLDGYQSPLVAWIDQLPTAERSELRSEVERQADDLVRRWPSLDPGWLPRTRETLRVPLAAGRVEIVARVDLAIGRPSRTDASVALVEATSGERRPSHRDDRYLVALVETLRRGVPPFVVATYFTSTGEIDIDPVTPRLLVGAARRCVAGMQALAAADRRGTPDSDGYTYCGGCAEDLAATVQTPKATATVTPVIATHTPADEGLFPFPHEQAA